MAFIGCTLQASSQFYAARMPAVVVLLPGLQRGSVQSERPVMSQCPRIRLSRSKTCDQLWHFNSFLIPDTGIIRSFEFGSKYSPHSARTFGDSNGPSQAQRHLYFEAVAAFLSLEQVHPFKQTTPCGSFFPCNLSISLKVKSMNLLFDGMYPPDSCKDICTILPSLNPTGTFDFLVSFWDWNACSVSLTWGCMERGKHVKNPAC